MRYHDFDIRIIGGTEGGYPLLADCVPHGEASDVSPLDPDCEPIRQMRARLSQEKTDVSLLTELGSLLYSALFQANQGNIQALFERCWGDFIGKEEVQGLRIRLRIEPPNVASLPWEFLYSSRINRFLSTSIETALVRYIELAQRIPDLRARLPLRILVAVPEGGGLDPETETANLLEALRGLEKNIQTTFLKRSVTLTRISDTLLEQPFHLFHFIGHGDFQNDRPTLLLDGRRGDLEAIDHKQFAGLFLNHPTMKLVLLNSCKGAEISASEPLVGMASQLVQRGIPAVIAMQYAIGDRQAILFAREFYRCLFRGGNRGRVEAAISYARNRLLQEFPGDRAVGTPVLFTRAPEGVLFNLDSGTLKDIPYRLSQQETLEAVSRTYQQNIDILEKESQGPGEASTAELLSQERAEHARVKERLRLGRIAFVTALFVGPLLFGAAWLGLFDRLPPSLKFQSYLVWLVEHATTKTFSDRIALVSMSEKTQERFKKSLRDGNWRGEHARLVDTLAQAGARVIAFDIYFRTPKTFDAEFSSAIRRARERGTAVVVGVEAFDEGRPEIVPALAEAASGWGILCLGEAQESSEIVPLLIERADSSKGAFVPSLALTAVAAYHGAAIDGLDRETMSVRLRGGPNRFERIGVSELDPVSRPQKGCRAVGPGDLSALRIIDFSPRQLLLDRERRFTYEDILMSADPRSLASVKGKIVVVGVETPTEISAIRRGLGSEERYGFELHADAINTLLKPVTIRPLGDGGHLLLIFGLSLIGGFLWLWQPNRPLARWGILLAVIVLYLAAAAYAYAEFQRLWAALYHIPALLLSYAIVSRLRRHVLR